MANVALQLGDFTFSDTEIPEHIPMPTKHQHVVHRMVGGARQVDMLGADYDPIQWSGFLIGSNALDRAQALKALCVSGVTLYLSWSEFFYQVVVTECTPDFEREYQIPYHIVCTVVQDMNSPVAGQPSASFGDMINGDMGQCTALTASIGDTGLSSAVGTLQSAVSAVSNFATAAKSTINSVLGPLNQVKTVVGTLIASTENTLQSVTTLGGILPNNPIAQSVAKLSNQINAMQNQTNLVQLNGVLGRMGSNLAQIGGGSKTIMQAGGSLFDLASKYYGKVSGWTAISAANPQLGGETTISGNQSIVIPPYTSDSGGILNA